MKFSRICIVLTLLMSLSACGMGQFFIKRSVMGLEKDIASEFKSFASFSDAQELEIDRVANLSATWMRSKRLLVLQSELEKLAADIETNARLEEQNWRSFVAFLEDPFLLDQAPEVLTLMSKITFEMTDEQSRSAMKKLAKDHRKESRELVKLTPEKQLDELMSGLKTVFKELGIARSKQQLKDARSILSERSSYVDFYRENSKQQFQAFSALLSAERGAEADFNQQFMQAWELVSANPRESMPEQQWQHNFNVGYSAMNGLLRDLDHEQKINAAKKIRQYADLFGELSVVNE